MSYLGFDHDRLTGLRRAAERVADDLRAVSSHDPLAADVVGHAHGQARQLFDTWLPLFVKVLGCGALTTREPVLRVGDVASLAPLGLRNRGWTVLADPLHGEVPMTTVEAAALASSLNDTDLAALANDEEQWAELIDTLRTIAADPAVLAAFGSTFEAWDGLLAAIALRRSDDVSGGRLSAERHTAHRADVAVVGDLLQRLDAIDGSLAERVRELARSTDPWTLATLCDLLQLDSATAGFVVAAAIRRAVEQASVDQLYGGQPDVAAALLSAMAHDPVATRLALVELGSDAGALLVIARPSEALGRVLHAALDPRHVSPAEAGPALAALLDGFAVSWPFLIADDAPSGPPVEDLLVDLSIPWLPWFGPNATAFRWTARDGADRMAVLALTAQGQAALLAGSGRWLSGASDDVLTEHGAIDWRSIDTIAGTVTLVIETMRRAEIDEAALDRAIADAVGAVVRQLPRLLPLPPGPAKVVGTKALGAAIDGLDRALTTWGVLPPGATMAEAAADANWAKRVEWVDAALFVVAAEQLIAAGRLPPEARAVDLFAPAADQPGCSAARTRELMTEYITRWEQRYPAASELVTVRDAMLNWSTTAVACR